MKRVRTSDILCQYGVLIHESQLYPDSVGLVYPFQPDDHRIRDAGKGKGSRGTSLNRYEVDLLVLQCK